MKKNLLISSLKLLVFLTLIIPKAGFGQALTGTYSIPGAYSTISAAVTALNSNGVGAGGATFNVAAGYTETLTSTIVLTATGTQANPIVFQKSGVGANPVITSYTGSAAVANTATLPDGILALAGSDYVTIDGINFTENAANTTAATTMEYGIGLFKASGTDGARYNTIRNCVITLNRVNNTSWAQGYNGSIGITVNNTTYNAATTAITVTASTGSNSYNKFYTNTIQNCNAGITLNGFGDVSPFSLGDTLNDIGGIALSTGNTIINFGGGASAANPSLGIYAKDQWGLNISYNTVNNNNGSGVNHTVTLRGIYTSNSSPNSSININNNILSIKGGGTTSQVSVIEQNGGISGTNNTININNNTLTGCQYLTATSGVLYGIYNLGAAFNLNITGNNVEGISYSGSALTGTGTVYGIWNSAIVSNLRIRSNTVGNISRTGTSGGTTIGIYVSAAVVSGTISNNTIDSLTIAGTGTGGAIQGIQTAGTNVNCDSNTIFFLRITKSTGTGLIYGIFGGAASTTENYRRNTIYNLIHSGSGLVYGYYTASAGTKNIIGNTIYNLTSTGSIAGINIASGILNINSNKIYDITTNTTTTSTSVGIQIGSVTASINHLIYNNAIGRILSPTGNAGATSNVVGINITNTTANNTFKVYHNTVFINATSTGATGFSTSCIQNSTNAAAGNGQLDLRNNILVNLSTATGTGFTSVLRRTSAQLGNFGTSSNYNLFYAGTPGAKNLIYYDGTNAFQTLAAYIGGTVNAATVAPRDANSITENLTFISTIGSSSNFLKINTAIVTGIESGGRLISGINTDFSGNFRAGFVGYTGLGGAPDLGAFEDNYSGNSANNMTYVSSDVEQITGSVPLNTPNSRILRIKVVTNNAVNGLIVSAFNLNTGGSTDPSADITNAKIWFTNSDSTFSATTLFGTTSSPNGLFTVTGSAALNMGTNYFWLTYDISASATGSNFVDASVDDITVDGIAQIPSTTSPTGSRIIQAPLTGTYYIGVGQVFPNYTTITSALADVNSLGLKGPVTFLLSDALYNAASGETFPLVMNSYLGYSPTNKITIKPAPNIYSNIEGNASNGTFELNGISNLTIDGRPDGSTGFVSGNNLIISNTASDGPTIRFLNDADSNIVTYADLRSNNSFGVALTGAGVVSFQNTTGSNGNDNNTISYCDIHEYTAGNPIVGISSMGTLNAGNDNNVIDNCNVYNFHHASFGTSGIYLGTNNSSWTITNNHFYQTANRTFTGASQINRVIAVIPNTTTLTTMSGFVINNNFIGGNASDGTGTYSFSASGVSTQFFAMDLGLGQGTASEVQGNTITNMSIDNAFGTGDNFSIPSFVAMRISNGRVNVGTTTGNLIGSRTTNGAITYNSSLAVLGSGGFIGIQTGTPGGNAVTISNNIISGITASGNFGVEILGINARYSPSSSVVTVSNNMIGDTSLANSITLNAALNSGGSARILGIYNNLNISMTSHFNGNIIANLTSNHTSSIVKGILVSSPAGGGTVNLLNNTIYNLSNVSSSTGTGGTAALGGIVVGNLSSANAVVNCSNNRIHSLTSTASTGNVSITGISYRSAITGTNTLNRNFIHSIGLGVQNDAAIITGIELIDGNCNAYNNIVRLGLDSAGVSILGAPSLRGIVKNGVNAATNTNKFYFNTVYIGGSIPSSSGDTTRTYAFLRTGLGTDEVKNNVFYNVRTNGSAVSARHFAVGLLDKTTLTMDYNLLKGDSIGLFATTPYLTMPNWKSGSGIDANSASTTMDFINATGDKNALDMHVNSSIATAVEAFGTAVSGTGTEVDYDGETRASFGPVDIGADAGNFISKDVASPVITYTPLVSNELTGNRIISTNITDATGIYLTGSLVPRIYFKKFEAGAWNSAAGTLVSGNSTNSNWDFTISSSTLGNLVATDSVYYFITAQDSTALNSLGSSPGGIDGTDVNTISVYPAANNFYVKPVVSGTYLVGNGQTYTNLTNADGLFNYMNSCVVGGNISIQITSDIEESGTFALNATNETSPGSYAITISPDAAVQRNITANIPTINSAIIRLNGADRVKIDGSFGGSGRYLLFRNRHNNSGEISLLNDAKYDTITNCILEGVNISADFGMLNFLTIAAGGTGNDSNVVMNCMFRDTTGSGIMTTNGYNRPNIGIYNFTGNVNSLNDNNQILNCEFNNMRLNAVYFAGTGTGNYWTIYNNAVYNTSLDSNSTVSTMLFQISGGGGHIIRKNSFGGSAPDRSGAPMVWRFNGQNACIRNSSSTSISSTIDSNTIGNIWMNAPSGSFYAMFGGRATIQYNTVGGMLNPWDSIETANNSYGIMASGVSTIQNNLVGNIRNSTGTSGIVSGIYGSSGSYTIRNNTVRNIYHGYTGSAVTASGPIGIYALPNSGEVDSIDNNIVYNIDAGSTGGLTAKGIQFGTSSSSIIWITRNKVYNVTCNTKNKNALAIGILSTLSGTNIIANNQISLGLNSGERIIGIFNNNSANAMNIYHNSIFIEGSSDTSSYGIYNGGAGTINSYGNLIYNKRTVESGTGNNFAFGFGATISGSLFRSNLFVVVDTSNLYQIGFTSNSWTNFHSLFTSNANTNWAERTSIVSDADLFTSASACDLSIKTTNPEAWYANGKGIAMADNFVDYNNTSRSTTIAAGPTDIGAFEFTPSSTPPSAFEDATPSASSTSNYVFASRRIATVNWSATGSLPTTMAVKYYSGSVAPSLNPVMKSFNAYYSATPTGGSGFDYSISLAYDSANFGNIPNSSLARIARKSSGVWFKVDASSANPISGIIASNSNLASSTLPAIFTLSDTVTIPYVVTTASLSLTAFLEGLYLGSSTMTSAPNNAEAADPALTGLTSATVADTILVQLHSSITYDSLFSWRGPISTLGVALASFPGAVNGNSYYIVIKHRNSLETWSANPVSFGSSSSYNFSTSSSQAYGDNMVDMGSGVYGIFTGDINQDGEVNSVDYTDLDPDQLSGVAFGYRLTDLNGDGEVNSVDYVQIDQNQLNSVYLLRP